MTQGVLQAQGELWDATTGLEEKLLGIQAQMREVVCRRFKPTDLKLLEAGEHSEAEELGLLEEPSYQQHFQSLRYRPCTASSPLFVFMAALWSSKGATSSTAPPLHSLGYICARSG